MNGLDAANQALARQFLPGFLWAFHKNHGVHEAFKAHKVGLGRGKILREGAGFKHAPTQQRLAGRPRGRVTSTVRAARPCKGEKD
jgi:hypothetical protein